MTWRGVGPAPPGSVAENAPRRQDVKVLRRKRLRRDVPAADQFAADQRWAYAAALLRKIGSENRRELGNDAWRLPVREREIRIRRAARRDRALSLLQVRHAPARVVPDMGGRAGGSIALARRRRCGALSSVRARRACVLQAMPVGRADAAAWTGPRDRTRLQSLRGPGRTAEGTHLPRL